MSACEDPAVQCGRDVELHHGACWLDIPPTEVVACALVLPWIEDTEQVYVFFNIRRDLRHVRLVAIGPTEIERHIVRKRCRPLGSVKLHVPRDYFDVLRSCGTPVADPKPDIYDRKRERLISTLGIRALALGDSDVSVDSVGGIEQQNQVWTVKCVADGFAKNGEYADACRGENSQQCDGRLSKGSRRPEGLEQRRGHPPEDRGPALRQ